MNRISKFIAGAAAAAVLTVSTATPALARHDDDDIDAGDVIAGVAIIGGIAAIASALDRDRNSYGYDSRYRYRGGYTAAVNSCGYEAQRYGRGGRVRIYDVDRRGGDRYRVRGVIETGFGGGYGGYDRYGGYGGYDRYEGYDRYDRYGGGGYGNDRYGRGLTFACTARGNGRITDFDINRNRW